MKLNIFDKEATTVKTVDGIISLRGLFVPFFIEQILMNMMGTVNTLILGHFSDEAVAAVGAANQILGFVYTFYAVISGGASVVISHRLGEGNEKEAGKAAFSSLVFVCGLSLLISFILSGFANPLMTFMHLEGEVKEMAVNYFNIVIRFSFVQSLITAVSAILRSNGLPKPAVTVSILMNALNAFFNYIVIMRPFETPFYGTTGVALGNTLARIISMVVIFIVLQKSRAKVTLKGRSFKDFACMKSILRVGVPGGVANLSYSLSQVVTTSILGLLGTAAISAKIYISSIVFYVYVVGYSMGISGSILMGWLTGAGEYEKAYKLTQRLLKMTILLNLSLSIIVALAYKPILGLFTQSEEIIAMAGSIFIIDIFVEFGRAFNHIEDNALRGAGDVMVPMIVNIVSSWSMSILFSYILGVKLGMGLTGCWIAFMMDEIFRGSILFLRFRSRKWMQKNV